MNSALGFDWDISLYGRYEALVCGDRAYTNVELRDHSARLASGLRALGIAAGARIAVQLDSGAEFVIALEAALRGGFVFVPVSVETPPALRQRLLDHCAAAAFIAASQTFERDGSLARSRPHCIAVNRKLSNSATASDFWDVIATHAPLRRAARRRDADAALIQYSSGTTGTPKGVIRTHGHLRQAVAGSAFAALRYRGRQWFAERRRAAAARPRPDGMPGTGLRVPF